MERPVSISFVSGNTSTFSFFIKFKTYSSSLENSWWWKDISISWRSSETLLPRKKVNSFVKRDIEVSHYISQLSALLPLITWDKITIGIDWTSSVYKFCSTKHKTPIIFTAGAANRNVKIQMHLCTSNRKRTSFHNIKFKKNWQDTSAVILNISLELYKR